MAADPLEWLQFEWRLDEHLQALRDAVVTGSYRTVPPERVRAAKSIGLTRPTAFFGPEDMLLYRNIVALADADLMRAMRPWTRFGRSDAKNADGETDPESGWFRAWLTRMGQLWTITESHEWLVETDISNFFPSVQLDAVSSHVLGSSRLSVEVVRLLNHILRESAAVPEYRVSPVVGLPQESFDCSRILAHSFLHSVDEAFVKEGAMSRYSRYMDDIVIGADSREEGWRYIARAQRALEDLGLYPNTAKTRIVRREDFARELMKQENDDLGDLSQIVDAGGQVDVVQYKAMLQRHLSMRDRPRAWERVLRRHYTLSRQLRQPALIPKAGEHLVQMPGSARPILDYLSTFQMTKARVGPILAAVDSVGDLYEDLTLLALQYLAVAPNVRSATFSEHVAAWAWVLAEKRKLDNPRIAASAVVVAAKFNLPAHSDAMHDWLFGSEPVRDDLLRRQLGVILFGSGYLGVSQLLHLGAESQSARRSAAYLEALSDGNPKAISMCQAALAPRERRQPLIFMVPPRPMFLAPLVRPLAGKGGQADLRAWRKRLVKSEGPRDRVGESWIGV